MTEPTGASDGLTLGAIHRPEQRHTTFRVWAPEVRQATVEIEPPGGSELQTLPLHREGGDPDRGYHSTTTDQAPPGTRYHYRLDGGDPLPDPASRFQPEGVPGPSEVVSIPERRPGTSPGSPPAVHASSTPPINPVRQRADHPRAVRSDPSGGRRGTRSHPRSAAHPGPARPEPSRAFSAQPPSSRDVPQDGSDRTAPANLSAKERRAAKDRWQGVPLDDLVLYELHVGTFTPEGTFDAIHPHLPRLADLGVTALELMPVAQFPGARNWGYDGVFPCAAQNTYGGPTALRRLVDACHAHGLAIFLDVVHNHLGPEGNVLPRYAPYFTDRHRTPWGPGLNFDGPGSDEVRRFFIESALWWTGPMGCDGLRLDAVHAILDRSERPFLAELSEAVETQSKRLGRPIHLIAESARNTLHFLRPRAHGGCGCAAQWSDDFHHALHALLTGERIGYYQDFGRLSQLATAMGRGFVYTGQRSRYRGRRHGESVPPSIDARRFVVFAQNHDQAGNRPGGERLAGLVPFEALKLTAAAILLAPNLPLLFMGEEYGEERPFFYFTDHRGPELADAVRRGRRREMAGFGWPEPLGADPPDPQAEEAFERSRLGHAELGPDGDPRHRVLHDFHRELLRLRRDVPALATPTWDGVEVEADEATGVMTLHRARTGSRVLARFNFTAEPRAVPAPDGPGWRKLLDSTEERWLGPGPSDRADLVAPHGVVVQEETE